MVTNNILEMNSWMHGNQHIIKKNSWMHGNQQHSQEEQLNAW